MESEAKKGFLVIGILIFICLAVTAGVVILGWYWFENNDVFEMTNGNYPGTPIDIDRNEFEAYIKSLGYTCEDKPTKTFVDFEYFNCGKQIQGESFNLFITYSKSQNKPLSLSLSIQKSENKGQKEVIAKVFSELARIPYSGSHPDEAASWVVQWMEIKDFDSFTVSKGIAGVSFSILIYADQYELMIGSDYSD
jgi:hypothetical protein